uniref:LRRCT domain-containing protein n=1 Tax=Macrostomum lignano TaxID=282301 RepID=A0A1I8ITA2_9PLAT
IVERGGCKNVAFKPEIEHTLAWNFTFVAVQGGGGIRRRFLSTRTCHQHCNAQVGLWTVASDIFQQNSAGRQDTSAPDASNNKIQSASARLVNLKALRIFKLRNNALQSVPEEWCHLRLHCLDLSVNQLTNLPPAYSEMRPGLTQLNLELNPMQSPPPHVCCRGPSHVLKFLASCRAGTELPWHYAKPSSSSGAAVSSVGRRNQNNLSAATSKEPADATVANSTGVLIAAPEDFADFNGDAL